MISYKIILTFLLVRSCCARPMLGIPETERRHNLLFQLALHTNGKDQRTKLATWDTPDHGRVRDREGNRGADAVIYQLTERG